MVNDAAAEFAEHCADQRWFVDEGWVPKQLAVDNLQLLAEHGGFVEDIGQDEVQRLMSAAFEPAEEMPTDYAAQLVRQWELADPRDRWRWTGELPPKPEPVPEWPARERYRTPQATVDAFWFVVRLDNSDYLADWLMQHPLDAKYLHELWGKKCSTKAA
jgi:hypothetical protein